MCEFLKEYHLFGDMCRLNNEEYFAEGFDVQDIHEFLGALTDPQLMQLNNKTLRIYLLNLIRGKEKSVFVELKWLLCLHQQLEAISYPALLEKIYDALSRMEVPVGRQQKIEEFMAEGMLKPYIHFLAKICLIRLQEAEWCSMKDKENLPPKSNIAFMRYNLIKYTVTELFPTTLDLTPFLTIYYPFLAKISLILHRTLTGLLRAVKKELKEEGMALDQIQLMDLEDKVEDLDQIIDNPSYLEMEPTQIGSRMTLFMNSAHNPQMEQPIKQLPSPKISQF